MNDRRVDANGGELEERVRAVEMRTSTHEVQCEGRHKALDLRFDGVDAAIETVRRVAAAADEVARRAALDAAIGRATIISWLKGLVTSVGLAVATQIPWVQIALHVGHLLP